MRVADDKSSDGDANCDDVVNAVDCLRREIQCKTKLITFNGFSMADEIGGFK